MRCDLKVNVACPADNVVGESIIWDNRRERLVWVDIVSRAIHPFTPKTSEDHFWSTLEMPTSIRLRAVDGAIGGFLKTLVLWDNDNDFREIAEVEPHLQ